MDHAYWIFLFFFQREIGKTRIFLVILRALVSRRWVLCKESHCTLSTSHIISPLFSLLLPVPLQIQRAIQRWPAPNAKGTRYLDMWSSRAASGPPNANDATDSQRLEPQGSNDTTYPRQLDEQGPQRNDTTHLRQVAPLISEGSYICCSFVLTVSQCFLKFQGVPGTSRRP